MKSLVCATLTLASALLFGAFAATGGRLNGMAQTSTIPGSAAAIEPDGTLDTAFDPGPITNGQVSATASQPDGKILISGQFSLVHGTTRLGIARLNADGTLDNSFNPPAGIDFNAQTMVVQTDGRVLVVSADDTTVNFVRLNSDGSAQVRGKNDSSGIGVVQVYFLQ
jgi:uncharacterized delta-60 repeat protein